MIVPRRNADGTLVVFPSAATNLAPDDTNNTGDVFLWSAEPSGETLCSGLPAERIGTPGDDVIVGTSGDDVIHGLGGDDIIRGKGGNDTICGGAGNDTIRGNSNDKLYGGLGNDVLVGGAGKDTTVYYGASAGVTVDLAAGTGGGADQGSDTITRLSM